MHQNDANGQNHTNKFAYLLEFANFAYLDE